MGNLFCSEYAIHRRFDLKGSSHGRTTDKPDAEIDPTTTLKDLDLNYIFRLQKVWFQEFCRLIFAPISHSYVLISISLCKLKCTFTQASGQGLRLS